MNTPSCQRLDAGSAPDAALWLIDLDAYADTEGLDGLGPAEHARAARLRFARDARRYLAARHALRRVLATALELAPSSLAIQPDPLGKLRLPPEVALEFNASRSGPLCLIGLSRPGAIGVDIETVRPVAAADGLARAHFTARERRAWRRTPGAGDLAFLRCWTRKEACLKALGVGLLAPASAVETGCGPDAAEIIVPLGQDRCTVCVRSLDLGGGAVGAVALATREDAARAHTACSPP